MYAFASNFNCYNARHSCRGRILLSAAPLNFFFVPWLRSFQLLEVVGLYLRQVYVSFIFFLQR